MSTQTEQAQTEPIPERKFRYIALDDGFRLETPFFPTVHVCYDWARGSFYVSNSPDVFDLTAGPASARNAVRGMHFGALVQAMAEIMLEDYDPERPNGRRVPRMAKRAQIIKQIGPRVYEQRARLQAKLDPDILAVKRAVFAATLQDPPLTDRPELYAQEYLVRDLVRYRAAAILLAQTDRFADTVARTADLLDPPPGNRRGFLPALPLAPLVDFSGLSARWQTAQTPPLDLDGGQWRLPIHPAHAAHLVHAVLPHWRDFYSFSGASYHSLNVTLDRLPAGLGNLYRQLGLVRLPRPMIRRSELALPLLYAENYYVVGGRGADFALPPIRPFLFAHHAEICRALAHLGKSMHDALPVRQLLSLSHLVQVLFDAAEALQGHTGNLVGMVDKAIAAHRAQVQQRAADALGSLPPDTPTVPPPIELPSAPEITFLATAQAVIDEGAAMGHCVAGYARFAVQGHIYLFHVETRGEQATVEVTRQGEIRQARGPRNQTNAATRWATRALARWAEPLRSLPPVHPAPVHAPIERPLALQAQPALADAFVPF